jgi:predicted ATPase
MLTEGGRRLVTLTGPGGIGKSRLAVAAAREVEAAFPDGVVFVDLAQVLDAGLVITAVANALGIGTPGSGRSRRRSPGRSPDADCCSCSTTSSRSSTPHRSSVR